MSEAEQQALRYDIAPLPCQQLYFTTLAYGKLQPLFSEEPEKKLEEIRNDDHILLVTGIASPAAINCRLIRSLLLRRLFLTITILMQRT